VFRRKLKVVHCRCRECGRKMRVVTGSVPYRERLCNLCVYAEARRRVADAPTLMNVR
jgi:hypothetical protein